MAGHKVVVGKMQAQCASWVNNLRLKPLVNRVNRLRPMRTVDFRVQRDTYTFGPNPAGPIPSCI